ncbi:MAG: squalene/phytoene synthase family protein [Amaricoccus sp.]
MTPEHLTDSVARGDPERWRAAMTAPAGRRTGLLALYGFNLEIARASWVASEPMLAQIRLRWWADALAEIAAGMAPRRHEIVAPLAEAIGEGRLPMPLFEAMIEARARDAETAPHPDRAALDRYVAATAGALLELAVRHLGAPETALPAVRDFAQGAGIAALLRARPTLLARGRDPLPPGLDPRDLARDGLALIARARANRALVPAAAAPALLGAATAAPRLRLAARGAAPDLSEFRARSVQLARGLSGRW